MSRSILLTKYPDRIPVRLIRDEKKDTPELERYKYLIPREMTVGQFMHVVRSKMVMKSTKALFFLISTGNDHFIPPTSQILSEIHDPYQDEKGILNIVYATENTFGAV